ncbi:ROK family transcriptional regulator [Auraticoccus monumenti]|uniref:Sugar kinase of the NBD/HSP70 family, may contain an N-terminal HTH domain n=1 Tax=Auraticoccus monumenti TaxID=675864 RepID=A0A1G6Z9X9_9ACTN|nr:ROK family transcriptional regulator [Auraticoccus monumenti]SDD99410.1 Sugar kinase of the NBD/HSP70 family, may contain an N-terminal HTH domain [Auraticoccus monumenti]
MQRRGDETSRSPRAVHEEQVLTHLRRYGACSRAELVAVTGLSRATVSQLSGRLIARGQVVTADSAPSPTQVGRPPETLTLTPAAGLVLGVDFGHARVALVLADAAHEVAGSRTLSYRRDTGWDERSALALTAGRELVASRGRHPLAAAGVGVPGGISGRAEVQAALETQLGSALGVPVRSDNNARLAGLAETVWGAARGVSDVAYLKLSNGVGGALVLGGRIHTGQRGQAGEFGHVCVDAEGPLCRCGKHGCLERYVRLDQVLADAGHAGVAELRAALDRSERRSAEVVRTAGRRIGAVLAGVATVTDVVHVVVGGELIGLGEHLLDPVRRTLRDQLGGPHADAVRVEPARLGDYAGALGAIARVLHDDSVPLLAVPDSLR